MATQGTYKPQGAFKRDLAEAGLSYVEFTRAIAFFAARGIDFNHVQRRGFRFTCWVSNRPQMVILWCGTGATREWLDAPSTLLAEMSRLVALALAA